MKKKIVCLLLAVFAMCMAITGCSTGETAQERNLVTELKEQSIEIGEKFSVPGAVLKDEAGNEVNELITMRVYNPEDAVIATRPGAVRFNMLGAWKVVYSATGAEDVTVVLTCKDSSAPAVSVANFTKFGYVNEELTLPDFRFEDFSEINYEKTTMQLEYRNDDTETWEQYEYDRMTNTMLPSKAGFYRMTVHMEDALGNAAEEQYEILIIDETYQFPGLKEGYIAGYDHDDYRFFVGVPEMAHSIHWSGRQDPDAAYVTDVAGAVGGDALKVNLYRGSYGAIFQLRFPSIPQGSLDQAGDTLVVRFKGGNDIGYWFVNDDMASQNLSVLSEADENGWRTLTVPLTQADLEENAYNLRSLEFISGMGMAETEEWYFDFVKINKTLEVPAAFTLENERLSWEPVEGADSYTVWLNGKEAAITSEAWFDLPAGDNAVMVKASGSPDRYVDSDWSDIYTTFDPESGYIASFNSEAYSYLVRNGGTPGGDWWNCTQFKPSYVSESVPGARNGDAFRINMAKNSNNVASLQISLPAATAGSLSGNAVLMRMKIDGDAVLQQRWANAANQNSSGIMLGEPDADGWQILSVSADLLGGDLCSLKTIELGFGNIAGSSFDLYIDWVKAGTKLEAPAGFAYGNGVLSWDEVPGATGYLVRYDDETHRTAETRYEVPADKTVTVKALGDGIDVIDSAYSTSYLTISIPQGFFADFNSVAYEQLVDAAAMPGNTWWDSASCSAEYLAQEVAGAEGGDALRIVLGRVTSDDIPRCGINITLPSVMAGSLPGNAILLRYKTDQTVKITQLWINWGGDGAVSLASYVQGLTPEKDADGWQILAIPLSLLSAAGNDMYSLRTIGIGFEGVTEETLELSFDWIKAVQKLDTPSGFVYGNGMLAWDEVAGAQGYIVSYGGKEYETPSAVYAVPADVSVTVKAVGDGYNSIDSDYSAAYLTAEIENPKNYYIDYNNSTYENLVGGDPLSDNRWWDSVSCTAEYIPEGMTGAKDGDALKVVLGRSTADGINHCGVNLTIPEASEGSLSGDAVVIRFKTSSAAKLEQLWINYNMEGAASLDRYVQNLDQDLRLDTDSEGWQTLTIPLAKITAAGGTDDLYAIGKIGMGFGGVEEEMFELCLDWIRVESIA